jgi:Sulfotransferase domain
MRQGSPIDLRVAPKDQGLALQIRDEVELAIEKLKQANAEMAVALLKRTLQKTPVRFQAYDIVVQNLLTAYKQRIEQLMVAVERKSEESDENKVVIQNLVEEALQLDLSGQLSHEQDLRSRFADTLHALALIFSRNWQYANALPFLRKALAVQPCPTYYVSLTNALAFTNSRAQLVDYTKAYTPERLGKHMFIACVPKSASTFLKNVLVRLTGYKDLFDVYAALQNEHELDMPILAKFGNVNTVTQQHCRASDANLHLMQAFQINPVVLVRNIYDSVISQLDFYNSGFTISTYFSTADFQRFTDEQRIDLIIDNVVPWYLQFVASWQRAEAEGRVAVHWLAYENMILDKPQTIAEILRFYGLEADVQAIRQTIAAVETNTRRNRFNKGVAGRGELLLSAAQKQRIGALARHYPSTDFSLLGL